MIVSYHGFCTKIDWADYGGLGDKNLYLYYFCMISKIDDKGKSHVVITVRISIHSSIRSVSLGELITFDSKNDLYFEMISADKKNNLVESATNNNSYDVLFEVKRSESESRLSKIDILSTIENESYW